MSETRYRVALGAAVLLIFVVSSNIAWLNPFPERDSFRGVQSVPFMWQYNRAAGVEIMSAAYFPDAFRTYTDRINRPIYPLAVWAIGNTIGVIASPVVELGPLHRAGAGYVVWKLLVYLAGALALFSILKRWLPPPAAFVGTLVTLFHYHMIEFVATFQTTELQVITPILVIWMMLRITDGERDWSGSRRMAAVALASFLLGVMMLAKQNYAVYLAVLLFLAYKRRFLEAAVSVAVHLIPLGLYLLFLRAVEIPYVNHEAETYGQGVWMLDMLRQNPIKSIQQGVDSLWLSLVHLSGFFSIWLVGAVAALAHWRKLPVSRDVLVFSGLLLFGTWAQVFAADRYYDYMLSDVAVVVFGLAVWLLWDLLQRWDLRRPGVTRPIATAIVAIWFLGNVLSFVHFPWVHPFDQPARDQAILQNRVELVEQYDLFTDEDRARARDGVLVEPGGDQ